jgi:hypothetical protein
MTVNTAASLGTFNTGMTMVLNTVNMVRGSSGPGSANCTISYNMQSVCT